MDKGLKLMSYLDISKMRALISGKYTITIKAIITDLGTVLKYPLTLRLAIVLAGLGVLHHCLWLSMAVTACSGIVPAEFLKYPQPLHVSCSLSYPQVFLRETRIQFSGHQCRSGGTGSRGIRLKESPPIEVVRSADNSEVYLATMSRNGISVSEPIPHHIFDDDDISDQELANYWLKVRLRLSSDLRDLESKERRA